MEKLEEVSNEGCGAATVVLARHACHLQNSQQFVRYMNCVISFFLSSHVKLSKLFFLPYWLSIWIVEHLNVTKYWRK